MSERVDKAWQTKGIDQYSTEAVLGTLTHYGVAIDEAGFKSLAQTRYPMGMAHEWMSRWKGKGQFSHFPASAAGLLWSRLMKDQVAPQDLASAWAVLVDGLDAAALANAKNVIAKLPTEDARRSDFLDETLVLLAPLQLDVGWAAEKLGAAQRDAEAAEFAACADVLYPGTGPALTARIKAGKGDRAGALADLGALAADAARPLDVRFSVTYELLSMRAAREAFVALTSLHTEAVTKKSLDMLQRLHGAMHDLMHLLPDSGPEYDAAVKMIGEQHHTFAELGHKAH